MASYYEYMQQLEDERRRRAREGSHAEMNLESLAKLVSNAYRDTADPLWMPEQTRQWSGEYRGPVGTARETRYGETPAPAMDVLDASGIVPGVGDVTGPMADLRMYLRDPEQVTPTNVGMSLAGMLPFVPSAAGVLKAKALPKKTIPAYRAHRVFEKGQKAGGLFPVMIGKDTPLKTALSQRIPLGETLQSELIPFSMAERQGYHSGALPYGEQFNVARQGDPNPWSKSSKIYQPDDVVYTQADLGVDNDYSNILSGNPRIYGVKDPLPFDQTKLPEGGFYMYKNPSTPHPWYVSDYVRHNRIITDEEIADIFRQHGAEPPPPRRSGRPIDEGRLRELGLL